MQSSNIRLRRHLWILAAGALCAFAAGAFGDSRVTKGSRAASLEACVAPTDDMRRNHMEYLKHQRDRTVHEGIRGSKHSLRGCVNCHAAVAKGEALPINAEGQFCRQCHNFTAVSIDCFQCHRTIPEQVTSTAHSEEKPLSVVGQGLGKGLRAALRLSPPVSADDR